MKGKHDSQQQQRGARGESDSSVAPSIDHEAQRQEPTPAMLQAKARAIRVTPRIANFARLTWF